MEMTFYGARGSYPIARRDQVRYGGNTTCLHFRTRSGQELILDGGSGIRLLGQEMMQREFTEGRGEVYILVGHTHWDHILGIPFFAPFRERNRFVVVSAGQPGAHIRDILSGQQSDINFPVSLEFLPARLEYLPFKPGDELTLGEFRVETVQLNHPGITMGYRIEADGGAVTVYTDTARVREVRLGDGMGGPGPDQGFSRGFLERLAHCARQADVLVHDTHFLEHEMLGRYHWGHSTVEDALEMARMAGVDQLVLFHHHPEHSDAVVDEKLALARDLGRGEPLKVEAAAEGWRLKVGRNAEEDADSQREAGGDGAGPVASGRPGCGSRDVQEGGP
jgi:phosphoribosyl 1,2-cyclic phosphodiesterase